MPIRPLPPLLVNQIAAGEVIERPASVVKECIENAIDAGAGRVDVAIEAGGRELIRISDDGAGIAFDELPMAIAPHATSKIERQDDLDAIATMGFRGEALASIASVSRLSIRSRPADQAEAGVIEVEGDRAAVPRPAGGPPGTSITVRNLFFNTPARRKFLKTDQTEAGRCREIVENLALAHPAIAFTLEIDGRRALELPAEAKAKRRALAVLGTELDKQFIEVGGDGRGVGVWGLAGRPDIARAAARHQRIFLNGRLIHDRSIMHAIKEAYRGLIEPGRYPTIVLFLQIDPALVDVNVHPTKAEVRFRNQTMVHGAVLSALREALRAADLTPAFALHRAAGPAAIALPPMPAPEFGRGEVSPRDHDEAARGREAFSRDLGAARNPSGSDAAATGADAGTRQFVEYLKGLDPKQKGFVYTEVKQALAREAPEILGSEREEAGSHGADGGAPASQSAMPTFRAASNVLQVHSSYLVTQDEEGLLIIDQHALHERVMFEKLRQRLEEGNLESQRLLMPAVAEVEPSQVDHIEHLKPLLVRLGIEAEPMGRASVAVHAFTSMLFERKVDPAAFMVELLEKAESEGLAPDPESALAEILDMRACKAAIKAGDRLSPDELTDLLRYRDQIERSSNCPHGRPTTLRLSLKDLEKQFGRK